MNAMDFGFGLTPSSHIRMDNVDLTLYKKIQETCPDISICMACGSCTGTCTAGNFTEMSFRRIILMIQRGEDAKALEMIQRCMFCGKCTLVCPRGINIRKILFSLTK